MSRYYQFKDGDEVFVRPDLERNTAYYMRSGYRADERYATLTYSQSRRLGTAVHISKKRNGAYLIEEDYGCDSWTDEMFSSPKECICTSLL